jgi:hypothetical protein
MSTIFDAWNKAAKQRARDYHAACVARSQARKEAGGPSLAEMYATYESLDPDVAEDHEIVDAINEELFASGTLEDCVEQQMSRMISNLRLQLIILPIPLN